MQVSDPIAPPFDEPCTTQLSQYPSPPSALVDNANENRLSPLLRTAAQTQDPLVMLLRAAVAYFATSHADALEPFLKNQALTDPAVVVALGALRNPSLGPALADLSVTGRAVYAKFSSLAPRESQLLEPVLRAVSGWPEATQDPVLYALRQALDRAYQVARAVRGHEARAPLGWIAVAGEDDPPDRPVNMPSAPYPQYDLTVNVKGIPIVTRYMIASESNRITPPPPVVLPPPPFGGPPTDLPRSLPGVPLPLLPWPDSVILFIHGHSSRLEESLDLVPPLHRVGREHGTPYTIIAMDLPCCGYSSMFDHTQVAPPEASDYDDSNRIAHVPILDFIEEFIVQFVNALEEQLTLQIQHIQDRIVAVIGGSLGGNMGLRLGRRSEPWLKNIVAWSPASVWDTFATPWNLFKQESLRVSRDRMNEDELPPGRRNEYFYEAFQESHSVVGQGGVPPQPQMWYREGWPCKQYYITGARFERQEIYNPSFRRWHWRVAREQLLFSHLDPTTPGGPPGYESIHINMLLVAGKEDNYNWSNIYDATQTIAGRMSNTPGHTLFLLDTGHSIHNERPHVLALAIEDFLLGVAGFDIGGLWHSAQPTQASGFGDWQIVGAARGLTQFAVGSNADGRLEIFAVDGSAGLAWHTVQDTPSGSFGGWSRLGGAVGLGQIAVISSATGGLEVFATDTSAGLAWTTIQDGPNGSFGNWMALGDKAGLHQIIAGRNADGRLEAFALDAAGRAWHTAQVTPGGGFGSWAQLGDAIGLKQIAVISSANGGLEIFAVDTSAGLAWTIFQDGPNGSFKGWMALGDKAGLHQIVAGRNADGRLEAFALDAAGRAWHTAQVTSSTSFGSWAQLGSAVGLQQTTVISGATGGLEVFAVDVSTGLAWTIFQDGPNGNFENWLLMGDKTGLYQIAAGRNADGRLEVFALLRGYFVL